MSMTTSGVAAPPRSRASRGRRPELKPPIPARVEAKPRASFERVLGLSLGGSLLVHLLLLLLSPLVIRVEVPPGGPAAAVAPAPQAFGLEMVIPIPSESAPEEPTVVEHVEPIRPSPATALPRATQPGDPPPTALPGPVRGSTREALRPGYRDPRLYVSPAPLTIDERTEHERYMDHLQARIDAVNDSLAIASNRERRTSDWTVTDGSGNRWGLSPEGLHIGGVTVPRAFLPLPAATGDNQSLEAERERQRQRDEIRRQQEGGERRDTENERLEAIREGQDQGRSPDGGN
jgi:hypothetical protein